MILRCHWQQKKQECISVLKKAINDISLFQVIVLWTANTERFCDECEGLNDTAENLLKSISRNEEEVSPSTIFAVASIFEKVTNTLIPLISEIFLSYKISNILKLSMVQN